MSLRILPGSVSATLSTLLVCVSAYTTANQPSQQPNQQLNQQSGQQYIQIHYQDQTRSGQVQTRQVELPAGGAVHVNGDKHNLQTQSLDPTKAQRLLVRLKDQPLRPYLKQQREHLAPSGKLSRAAGEQLAKSSQSQQQRLQKSQGQVLGELRKQKLVQQVHGQFTQLTNSLSITAAPNSLEQIRRLPQVAEVYPDLGVKAFLTDSVPVTHAPELWAMRDAQARPVTGQGIKVAILDTGIDYTHPDLGGCIGAGCKVVAGHNFIEGEDPTNPMDKHGHGTHVAGIVAAKGVLTGMAPDVSLYAYKVLNDFGYGADSSIIAALEKSVDPDGDPLTQDQMDIVNLSLGGSGEPNSPISEAANNAMEDGVLVVVAAGNSGGISTIGSPGNAEQVLTVGASDNLGFVAGFSSRGPIQDRTYVKPEVMAPGVDINSAKPGGSYVRLSGTSMATPHVVGGAALLKQLYPRLTTAELKTLLINSSKDMGQDIFSQGAGLMDLAQAARTKLLVSPALLSAGMVDIAQANWQASLPIRVKNISTAAVNVSASAPASFPAGASAIVSPAASASVAAGQEAAFDLQLLVDTKTLPYADSLTLYHQVAGSVSYGDGNIRLPLVFAKAAKLNLEFDGTPWVVNITNDDATYSSSRYFSSCDTPPGNYSVNLKPGKYHVAASFYNKGCGIDALVFKENIALNDAVNVQLERAAAVHKLAIGTITATDGNALSLEGMRANNHSLLWRLADVPYGSLLFLSGGTTDIIQISDISERIKVEVTSLFSLPEISPGVAGQYYLLAQNFNEGIHSSHYLDLDLRKAGGVEFHYDDVDMLGQGVTFSMGLSQLRSSFDFAAFGITWTNSITYDQPLTAKLFANISTLDKGEWYPDIGVNRISDDPFAWNVQLFRTGQLAFFDTNSYTKLRGVFSTPDATNYRSKSRELRVSDSAYVMAPAFFFSTSRRELQVQSMSEPYWYTDKFSIQRDAQQNSFFDHMAYRLYCDGTLKTGSDTNGGNFNLPLGSDSCNSLAFELDQPVRFQGAASTSSLRLDFDLTTFPGQETYLLKEFPEQLQFFSDGVATRILNGSDLEIQMDVRSMTSEVASAIEQPRLEYYLESSASWTPLALTRADNRYYAKLPVISGSTKGSLRISIDNGTGTKLVQTLNNIFVLGQGAVAQVIRPPQFAPLPMLEVEATGRQTSYSLPPIMAKDDKDGDLLATTSDLGPYSLGLHAIRWQAVNSAGKKASAIQSLWVRDTTPPSLTIPPDITVTATGAYTEVPDLGIASAVDLVDGAITPWTLDKGPYPVGVNSVIWNASDSRGNLNYRIQKVMVIAASSSAASSSSSIVSGSTSSKATSNSGSTNSGGGGGGGAFGVSGLLLLTLLGLLQRRRLNR